MGYSFWFKHHSFCLAIIMGRSSFIQLLAFSAVPFSTVDAVRFRYYGPNDVKRSEDASAKRHLDDPIIDPIIPDPVSSCEPVTVTVCDSSAISSAFASATSAFEASSSAVISSALASYTSELDFSSSLVAQSSSALAESSASLSSAIEIFSSVSASAAATSEFPISTQASIGGFKITGYDVRCGSLVDKVR